MARVHKNAKVVLPDDQRRLVLGVALAQLTLLSLSASLNYVLPSMVAEFQASSEQEALCRQASSLASLLVVFVAGILGPRLGDRRVLLWSAALFSVGCLVVAVAPSMTVVTVGLLVANAGKAVLVVVALAFLAAKIQDADGRATAFATISCLVPIAYLVMPLVSGAIVANVGWRPVAVIWVLCGLASMAAIARFLPGGAATSQGGEMLTPALAGLVLATGVQFIDTLSGGLDTQSITWGVLCAVSVIALVVAYRRSANPSLSLHPLRHGGFVLLLIIVILFSFANLYYYNTVLYQVCFGYSALGAAVIMIPTQLGSIFGAIVARSLLQRRGITATGTSMIGLMGIALLLTVTVDLQSPLWWPVVLVTLYAVASVAAFVALTNAVMNLAEPGDEGQSSSYKSAASNIGGAVGIALMTAVMTLVGITAMSNEMASSGDGSQQDVQAAWSILYGTAPADASDVYGIPISETASLQEEDRVAYLDAYHAQGLVGGGLSLLTAWLFFITRRRHQVPRKASG